MLCQLAALLVVYVLQFFNTMLLGSLYISFTIAATVVFIAQVCLRAYNLYVGNDEYLLYCLTQWPQVSISNFWALKETKCLFKTSHYLRQCAK